MDEYMLEHITADNDIRTDLFLPFTITRLRQVATTDREAILSVQLKDVGEAGESRREMLLSWSASGIVEGKIPLQERVVTEWAAVGVACVLMPLYADLRILQVTQTGDGFDYWVGDDKWEYALEVSGTIGGSLTGRHTTKVRQLQRMATWLSPASPAWKPSFPSTSTRRQRNENSEGARHRPRGIGRRFC